MNNQSFSEKVKKQILSTSFEQTCCNISALSAFVRGAGTLFINGGLLGFEIITENKQACDYFAKILEIVYGESAEISKLADKLKGRSKYTLRFLNSNSSDVLNSSSLSPIKPTIISVVIEALCQIDLIFSVNS